MRLYIVLVILIFFSSCKNEKNSFATDASDYNNFLYNNYTPTLNLANSEIEFWSKRLRTDSSGVEDLVPLAKAYTSLFEVTGNFAYIKNAEVLYRKAVALTHNKDGYVRLLATNLIIQQSYIEAKNILEESYQGVSYKQATEYLLFDVYFELKEYNKALIILGKLKNRSDIYYLFRLALWEEYKGNNDDAINNIKNAKEIAESRKSKELQVKSYLLLADLYVKTEKFNKAYLLILKTLQLQPDNIPAKKQMAWILYSYENDIQEANRILDSIMVTHKRLKYY